MNSNYYVTVKSNNRTGKVSMASIRDVARRAGVGVGTVSRVINGNGYVSADTKKKIEKAIEELEYTPNELARNLFRNKTGIVGILVPDVDHPFFSSYVRQTEAALYEVGYKTLISSTIGVSNREEEFLDMLAFLGEEVPVLTARDFLFHPGAASRQWEQQRLAILTQLTRGTCPLLVATVEGLLQRTLPQETLTQACRQLQVGQVCQLDDLTDFLVRAGYTRCDQVEGPGQFALRGGILDVFSPGLDLPLRMEFWGDEIDSMGLFDPVTQRRTAQRETCELLPAGEVISLNGDPISGPPDLALPQVYPQVATAADYLPPNVYTFMGCDGRDDILVLI